MEREKNEGEEKRKTENDRVKLKERNREQVILSALEKIMTVKF